MRQSKPLKRSIRCEKTGKKKKKNQFTEYKKMPQMGKLLKDNEGFRMRSNCPAAGLACGEGLFYTSPFEG